MITDELKHIKLASDVEFLEYVKYLRTWKYNKLDNEILMTEINQRLDTLGYTLEIGCCGTNKLHKKE